MKFVRISGVNELSADGISNVKQTADGMEFVFGGDINELLRALSNVNVKDLSIEEPSLEDVFMRYYN